jgi:hypothetical protein
VSSPLQSPEDEAEAEEVQAPLPELDEEPPKRSFRDRLFRRKPKTEEVKKL